MTSDAKQFATLAAEFALVGHALVRARPDDQQAPYYMARWGWLRPVHSLDEARQLLEQITGKNK